MARIQQANGPIFDYENDIKKYKSMLKEKEKELKKKDEEIHQNKQEIEKLNRKITELLAFQFRENAYYIVMGENYDDYYPEYSLAKMEIKICDIPDDKRRKNAKKNWNKFQADFQWSPEKAEVLEQLRRLRNEVAHPGDLDKTKALEAIDELHKQNKLRGLIKKDKVKNVVDMWEMSCNMAKYATLYD
ncbi:hypothetical protein AC249_AIPGENE28487 [Exaiptasia diaphana]|nr:hypothetical protein AC249_AIPGENE28487 [Exaiptasia diaphana]